MFKRLRTGSMAGSGALVLVMALSGIAMGAPLASDEEPAGPAIVDSNGDGIDDTCQVDVVEDAVAAEAAFAAADADGDGTISVTEAAHSAWVGGANCNHGGYVSAVAQADDTCTTDDESAEQEPVVDETAVAAEDETADCETDEEEADEDGTEAGDEAACEVVAAPEPETAIDLTVSSWHGAWVRWVAQSDAVGGANCNHGGAVSEAAKKDQEAAAAAREARKAERAAEREARAQEREAARAERSASKGTGKGKGH